MSSLTLSAASRRAFDRVGADLTRIFGHRFVALVASGPRSSVAFATTVLPGDLQACSALMETWRRDGLDAPLLLTPDEFRRSLDAFPVEYQALIDAHVVVAGVPPFNDAPVSLDELRRGCEIQAKGHLLHLRQGWVEAAGHDEELAEIVARSAPPLRALLSNVARLTGARVADEQAALAGAREAGLPLPLIAEILALEDDAEGARAALVHLPAYLDASERLWAFVDRWRS